MVPFFSQLFIHHVIFHSLCNIRKFSSMAQPYPRQKDISHNWIVNMPIFCMLMLVISFTIVLNKVVCGFQ